MTTILVQDVMTTQPVEMPPTATVLDAARAMREGNFGAVLVTDDSKLLGIVTDRDLVVRSVALGKNPAKATLGQVCSTELETLSPDDSVDKAVDLMWTKSLRRIPVTSRDMRPVGIVSLGDLALKIDPQSALGRISAARPNH